MKVKVFEIIPDNENAFMKKKSTSRIFAKVDLKIPIGHTWTISQLIKGFYYQGIEQDIVQDFKRHGFDDFGKISWSLCLSKVANPKKSPFVRLGFHANLGSIPDDLLRKKEELESSIEGVLEDYLCGIEDARRMGVEPEWDGVSDHIHPNFDLVLRQEPDSETKKYLLAGDIIEKEGENFIITDILPNTAYHVATSLKKESYEILKDEKVITLKDLEKEQYEIFDYEEGIIERTSSEINQKNDQIPKSKQKLIFRKEIWD